MTPAATFRDLARRAREASGADRQLDADVARALGTYRNEDMGCGTRRAAPPYSTSPDDTLRDVMPRRAIWWAMPATRGHTVTVIGQSTEWCSTLSRALLAAALNAWAALAEAGT